MKSSSYGQEPSAAGTGESFAQAQGQEIQALEAGDDASARLSPLRFVPTWDAHHSVLSTFTAGHWRMTEAGEISDEMQQFRFASEADVAAIDVATIRDCIDLLEHRTDTGRPVMLVVPIHYPSLASPAARSLVVRACHAIPDPLRRYVTLSIMGVPEDTALHVLTERVQPLHSCARALMLVITDWTPRTASLALAREFGAVSLVLPPSLARRQAILQELPAFVAALKAERKISSLVQVTSRIQVEKAVDAGVIHLTGSAIGGPSSLPGAMVHCGLNELPYRL